VKIGRLRVDPSLFEVRFAAGCDTRRCGAACCRGGVWLDTAERDRVVAHAELVQRVMDPGQPRDPRHWFSRRVVADADFPSGRAAHTRVRGGRCVFLDGARRCVLQKASLAAGNRLQLKPYFCTAFPITIDHGTLMLDDEDYRDGQPCCGATRGGPLTVFDVCRKELRHVLGRLGLSRLRRMAVRNRRNRAPC